MNDTLASLPRDTFVSNLVDKCRGRNIDIETIRYELLNIAKRQKCFPYRNASLKKRLGQRKPSSEPIEGKLGNDCYLLHLASRGEFNDDLKLVLNVKSQNVYSRKQSVVEDESHSDFFITSLGLKDTVIRLEREVNSLKRDHIQEIKYLNNTVFKLTEENKQLLDITSKNQERFKNFQNQITALRNTCENSDHQLSKFKIKFTQQNSQCDSHNEVISKLEKASSDLDKKAK
ncbi:unnamed protein product [Mytilus edulis]|uniref:Uncharacterized protein n=1 Tax=Mytilus edulis TaxID=6550 RepID=A0A8S3PU56_MYTED|nr:unnamed protein product [Mytilus edulis]